jgi:hypothetical protein
MANGAMKDEPNTPEFRKFKDAMKQILSVSHEELKRREAEWKKQRAAKKRAKPSASRDAAAV